ncbi:hypothetical protein P5673_033176 [Acropora cervicornis]|uniref:Uncharacterized protein n=1 Tax=Acropora cervicornis TaxID=6130 RepID=A0AAD9URI7_ACRCE|nr:hypothetical protein P5673_033176 [Acropora cervicornis]
MITNCTSSAAWNSVVKSKLVAIPTIELVKLCQCFELTSTFARVDGTKTAKCKRSAKTFEENVDAEELRQKEKRRNKLVEESNRIYEEIH